MSFSVDIQDFVKKVGGNADQVVAKLVLDLGRAVVEKTPVGDATLWENPKSAPKGYVGGRARGNWSHSIGAPQTGEFTTIDKDGDISIARIEGSIPPKAAGLVHFIQNSVPYIQALEDGHSKQAPSGMVGLTLLEAQGRMEAIVRGLK